MPLLIGFFVVFFLLIAFSSAVPLESHNPLSVYWMSQIAFIGKFLFYMIIGLIVLVISYSRTHHIPKHFHFRKKYLTALYHTLALAFMGFFLSFVLLFLIAFIELNVFAVVTYLSPKILGIETNIQDIVKKLDVSGTQPTIMASENDAKQVLFAVAMSSADKTSFYGGVILPAIPRFLVLPMRDMNSSIYLVDNTVIITSLNSEKIQQVSPHIGYLLIQHYFPSIAIKHYPNIALMSQEEYFVHRDSERRRKIEELDLQIIDGVSMLSSISGTLKVDEEIIAQEEIFLKEASTQKSLEYRKCRSSGTSKNGVFTTTYTKEYCEQSVSELTAAVEERKKTLDAAKKKLVDDQSVQSRYQAYDKLFQLQKKTSLQAVNAIPHEYGVFTPPQTIKLSLHRTDSSSLADYVATLTHEYLHYASYVSEDTFLSDGFFEEGLTEYFARQIIQNNLNIRTNIGYPVYYHIISQMTTRIPETELAVIYFTKDQEALVKTLNRAYGDGFYEQNRVLFAFLQVTSNREQILKTANTIMQKINGKPLTLQDVQSSETTIE